MSDELRQCFLEFGGGWNNFKGFEEKVCFEGKVFGQVWKGGKYFGEQYRDTEAGKCKQVTLIEMEGSQRGVVHEPGWNQSIDRCPSMLRIVGI